MKQKGFAQVFSFTVFVCFFVASYFSIVQADVAVPSSPNTGGSLGSSGSDIQVSMDYEKVIFNCGQRKAGETESFAVLPCHVSAVFKLKNNSQKEIDTMVVFPAKSSPFTNLTYIEDEITNFKADGVIINTIDDSLFTISGKQIKAKTFQWQETFPAGIVKEVTVEYDTQAPSVYSTNVLSYILSTGSTWQGPIKAGEVSFVFPQALTPYSTTYDLRAYRNPGITHTNISPTISGNTVTFTFQNLEPKLGEEIVYGFYDQGKVAQIEALKNQTRTYANILAIANIFKDLSAGPHCYFCSNPAGKLAMDYYTQAVNLATSENEILDTISPLTLIGRFGERKSGAETRNDIKNGFAFICLDSSVSPYACKDYIYDNPNGFGWSPIGIDLTISDIPEKDFLHTVANKARPFNPKLANDVVNYINGAKEEAAHLKIVKQSQEEDRLRQASETAVRNNASKMSGPTSGSTQYNQSFAERANKPVVGAIILVVALSIAGFIFRKRIRGFYFKIWGGKIIGKNQAAVTPDSKKEVIKK